MNNPIRFIDPDGMDAIEESNANTASVYGDNYPVSEGSDDDELVNYMTTQNKSSGEKHTYIRGDASPGSKEFHVDGLNGGAGVPFRSEDEAAFAWSLENVDHTDRGSNEYAGTIYSQNGKGGKTFSYNGSFEGQSENNSDFHETEIPKGATVEGFIHTHDIWDNFSGHTSFDDANQRLDRDIMNEHTDKDYYLLNDKRDLIVNRRLPWNTANDDRGGAERDQTLVSNIQRAGFTQVIHWPQWQKANGQPYYKGDAPPPFVDAYLKKRKN